MEYYITSAAAALLVAILAALLWRKSGTPAFVVGAAFLYFWTLFGAWSILSQQLAGGGERSYDYLYYKMFPVYVDSDYFWTLVLYTVFVLVVLVTALYFVRRPKENIELLSRPLVISHGKIILICTLAAVGSFLLIRDQLAAAAELNTNVHLINPETSRFYTLHEILDRVALTPLSMGLAVFVSGRSGKYVIGRRSPVILAAYLGSMAGVLALNLMTGMRNNLMFAATSAALLYLANTVRPRKLVLACGCVAAVGMLMVIGITRDGFKSKEVANLSWPNKFTYAVNDVFERQNESYAAHFSMYGVLHKGVAPTYGSSILWLVSSVVPRAIVPQRPMEIYDYYVYSVGAIPGQGYNIHHATGWYLNFGVPGIILGAFALGWMWAKLFNIWFQPARRSHFGKVFALFAFWNFTAFIPMLLRSGPEGYKGAIVEGILIQTVVLSIASLRFALRSNRPVLVPAKVTRRALAAQRGMSVQCQPELSST